MKLTAILMASGAALVLAACGSETSGTIETGDGKNAEYTIDKETGETSMTIEGEDGEATLRSGANVPVSLPAGFSLFPGSKVVTNTVVNQPDGQGTLIAFEADAPAEKVVAHYRDEAKAAGYDIEAEVNTNGTLLVVGERKGDGSGLSVTATTGNDGKTSGQVVFGLKKPG